MQVRWLRPTPKKVGPRMLKARWRSRTFGLSVTDFVALEVITALGKKLRAGQITRKGYRIALERFRREFQDKFNILEVEHPARRHSHQRREVPAAWDERPRHSAPCQRWPSCGALPPAAAGFALRGQAADRGCARGRDRCLQPRDASPFRSSKRAGSTAAGLTFRQVRERGHESGRRAPAPRIGDGDEPQGHRNPRPVAG